jgi:galactonate dehydratase
MKITDVKTVLLTGPNTNDPYLGRSRRSASFVEIHTDAGLVGLGETYAGYFCPELVGPIVDFFKPILIGQSPENIDELWRRMYHCENFWCRVGVGLVVMTGIEAALWDLKGKQHGLPVFELLGGRKHNRLQAYATGGPSNYPKQRLAEKIDSYMAFGFQAFKVATGSFDDDSGEGFQTINPRQAADFEADKLEFIRNHVGKNVKVLLDGHMGNNPNATWGVHVAKAVVAALEPYDLFLLEEPLHYTDPWGYAELSKSTSIAIAGGECLTGSYEWRIYIEKDCFDIGQPDASFTGGIGEFLKVAAMLDGRGRRIATHSWGSGGALMQNVHAAFACPNTAILEVPPAYGPLHSELVGDSFVMEGGMVLPPQTPGLGFELPDSVKQRYPFVPGSGEFSSVPGKTITDVGRSSG